jgi:hypothetical protein
MRSSCIDEVNQLHPDQHVLRSELTLLQPMLVNNSSSTAPFELTVGVISLVSRGV